MVGNGPTNKAKVQRLERFRHALWAGVLMGVLMQMGFFNPLDQLIWIAQDRAIERPATGEVAYISSERDLTDPAFPDRREELAQTVTRLREAGARKVYLAGIFDAPSTPEADAALNAALRSFDGKAFVAHDRSRTLTLESSTARSVAAIREGVPEIGTEQSFNYFGYTWEGHYLIRTPDGALPSIAADIAEADIAESTLYPINYSFDVDTFPSMSFADASADEANLSRFTGKFVIVGLREEDGYSIPGSRNVPPVLVPAYGAESLKSGFTRFVDGRILALGLILLVVLVSLLPNRQPRRAIYAAAVVTLLSFIVISALLGWRMGFSDALAFAATFGIFRLRSVWKDSFALVDQETGLPSFNALEADKSVAEAVPAIIVAKIHRFEEVRRTLPKELHAEYVLRITGRLKAATQDATIYLGQGHMIAWTMREKDPALLMEHLEGLRALFSSPLMVGEDQVDVGITFGVDITPSPNVARRLAAAVAVAEQTNEAYDPIKIADSASEEDLIWNISLQARIDAALGNGEIYLVFQPKVMVQTGEIIGVEALVRWKDPIKGHIPPDNFIRQCETAGRMSQLTRFVLEEACKAGNAFRERGFDLPIAVNISATLVHERNIVRILSEVLRDTGFDPQKLTLEITETYRISNIERASEILGELKALGPKISMDDFGVGAASLEALLELPFSELKIDRMFVSRMTSDAKAEGIVRSILQMGKDLRIIVVAEGVEDAGTLTLLRDSGCLVAQGFGISRPVEFENIVALQSDGEKRLTQNMV